VFYKDPENTYRVKPLQAMEWLIHGFGTRWSNSFGNCQNLATLRQIHSDYWVHADGHHGVLGEGDALITQTPGQLVAVKTADCIPVLIADPRTRSVAAIHAGWRGTAKRIAPKSLAGMAEAFGARPEDVHVAIGPGIGGCCYEVGPEVAEQFGKQGRVTLDLSDLNRRQLIEVGVNPERIYVADLCTACGEDFFSYRRDKTAAGRMISAIGIR
jgi:YfiH family protein